MVSSTSKRKADLIEARDASKTSSSAYWDQFQSAYWNPLQSWQWMPFDDPGGITSGLATMSTSPTIEHGRSRLMPGTQGKKRGHLRRANYSDEQDERKHAILCVSPNAQLHTVRSTSTTREPHNNRIPNAPEADKTNAVPSIVWSGNPVLESATHPTHLSRFNSDDYIEDEGNFFFEDEGDFDDDEVYLDEDKEETMSGGEEVEEEEEVSGALGFGQKKEPWDREHKHKLPIAEEISPQGITQANEDSFARQDPNLDFGTHDVQGNVGSGSQHVHECPDPMDSTQQEEFARHRSPMSSLGTASPSEASVSSFPATDDSEVNLAAALVSSHRTLQAQANLQPFFGRFVDLRLGMREVAGRQAGSSSRDYLQAAQHNGYGVPTTTGRDSTGSTKRSRGTEDGGNDSGEAPEGDPGAKRPKPETAKKLRIACPFMKNSPERFSTWTTCVGPGFDEMNRMKEHLKRRHFKEHTCERCGDLFPSKKALQDHQRLATPCILKDATVEEGFMTSTQWDEITRKRRRCSVEEKWKEIYLILFPDTPPDAIPSPYFDTLNVTKHVGAIFDPEEYEAYLKSQLPPRVLMRLERELAVFSEAIKAQLAVIVQEESSETLKAYVRQKSEGRNEVLPESTNLPPDLLVPDQDFFQGINIFGDEDLFDLGFMNGDGEWQTGNGKGKEPADSGYGSLG